MKLAIVHDWLTNMGGAEQVVINFKKIYPDAPIYTTFYTPEKLDDELKNIIVEHNFNVGTVKTNAKYTEALVQENEYIWSGKIGLLTLSELLYPSTISTSTQDITIGTTAYSNNYLLNYASGKFLWTANALNNNSSSVWTIGKDLIPTPKAASLATETI